MRTMTVAFALGAALVLGTLGTAQARKVHVVRDSGERLYVTPQVGINPYWDSNIVPRYRYRPQDDRIDPYGPPVVPVIRYGAQEIVLPRWYWGPGYW